MQEIDKVLYCTKIIPKLDGDTFYLVMISAGDKTVYALNPEVTDAMIADLGTLYLAHTNNKLIQKQREREEIIAYEHARQRQEKVRLEEEKRNQEEKKKLEKENLQNQESAESNQSGGIAVAIFCIVMLLIVVAVIFAM